jgi:DNA-binding transcriptional LysR family regulator
MHHRYDHTNIPIEIVRTLIAVAEQGSYSKAGRRLRLSQPTVTAQIKRLQTLAGGPIFHRGPSGMTLTERGTLILSHARKMLEANDQILSLGGATSELHPIRLGLPILYNKAFFKLYRRSEAFEPPVTFFCGNSSEIGKSFAEGYLDVVCLLWPPEETAGPVADWDESFVWVRSRDFVVSPGSPIPLVGWPGSQFVQPAIRALEKKGLSYRVVFSSYDQGAQMGAVAAGLGVMVAAEREVTEPLIVAKEYYLPELPRMPVGIRARPDIQLRKIARIIDCLRALSQDCCTQAA